MRRNHWNSVAICLHARDNLRVPNEVQKTQGNPDNMPTMKTSKNLSPYFVSKSAKVMSFDALLCASPKISQDPLALACCWAADRFYKNYQLLEQLDRNQQI